MSTSECQRTHLVISQHWFKSIGLVPLSQYTSQCGLKSCRHMASPSHNVLSALNLGNYSSRHAVLLCVNEAYNKLLFVFCWHHKTGYRWVVSFRWFHWECEIMSINSADKVNGSNIRQSSERRATIWGSFTLACITWFVHFIEFIFPITHACTPFIFCD